MPAVPKTMSSPTSFNQLTLQHNSRLFCPLMKINSLEQMNDKLTQFLRVLAFQFLHGFAASVVRFAQFPSQFAQLSIRVGPGRFHLPLQFRFLLFHGLPQIRHLKRGQSLDQST